MSSFKSLEKTQDLKEILKKAFDSDLPVSGSWGYTQDDVTVIENTDMPLTQIEHIFASMRAYAEMNMTLSEEERYASINLNEIKRKEQYIKDRLYHTVIYKVTAIKESTYNQFIKEYKEEYGKSSFDLNLHFEKRKASTKIREVTHWFQVSQPI